MSVRGVVLLAALALSGCTDIGPTRGPGKLAATLRSPSGDEGAAVLSLLGEGVLEVTKVGETEVYAVASGLTTRVVLINQSGGTLAFEVAVADVGRPVLALVREVAGPDDELRSDLSEYRVEFER